MPAELTDTFSVVSYVDGDLAQFVTDIRCEYTPGCPHRAHVTVLPPREIADSNPDRLADACADILSAFHPFQVAIQGVGLFEASQVVKLTVGAGASELRTLHDILNTGPLEQAEAYAYSPHMTLSMEIAERTQGCLEQAKIRWDAYQGERSFWVDHVTLVRRREDDTWTDLVDIPIGDPHHAPVRVRVR